MLPEIAIFAALAAGAGQSASKPAVDVGVTVHLRTSPPPELAAAKDLAARIYQAAGIDIVWHDGAGGAPCRTGHLELVVGIVGRPEPGRRVQKSAMGLAVTGRGVAGALAYIYYENVKQTARANHAEPIAVLGHAIAHEIGHLLLPYGSHSAAGLMRGQWQTGEFTALRDHVLLFSARESGLMKRRLLGLSLDAWVD